MVYLADTLKRCLIASTLALLATLCLYMVFDLIEHVRILLAYRADMSLLADLALAHLPLAIYHLLPLAVLLGGLAEAARMARDRDILALAASGQPMARRLAPFVALGVLAALVLWQWGEHLAPPAAKTYRQLVDIQIKHKHTWGAKWRPHRAWYHGPSGIWRVGSGAGTDLRQVVLFRFDENVSPQTVERMESLHFSEGQWLARNWQAENLIGQIIERKALALLPIKETPSHFRMIWESAEEMTLAGLKEAERLRSAQGLDGNAYRAERGMRMGMSLLGLVLPLLAVAIAWRGSRFGRQSLRLKTLALGIGAGLLVFIALSSVRTLAASGWLPPIPALLAVPSLAGTAALLSLVRIRL